MKYLQSLIISVLFLSLFSQPTMATVYKCKDETGKTLYSDKVCEGENKKTIEIKKALVNKSHKVDIYVTEWCPYCKKAMAYLKKHNISFSKYDIEKSLTAKRKKESLAPNYSGIPLTVIDGQVIKGFSEEHFDELFYDKNSNQE